MPIRVMFDFRYQTILLIYFLDPVFDDARSGIRLVPPRRHNFFELNNLIRNSFRCQKVPISQGLKAGLAAGVIYGAMVGLLHLGTLEACSSAQISYISQQLIKLNAPSNVTASAQFATDVIYFPMVYGLWALVYGVFYGAFFSIIYLRLPGSSSKKKAMVLGIPVFLIGVFAGPAVFFVYQCSSSFIPLISQVAALPVSFAFGYVLGLFYDSFGRLSNEEKENEKMDRFKANLRSIFSGILSISYESRAVTTCAGSE